MLREAKDLLEELTMRKVIRCSGFPFVSLRRRFIKLRIDFTKGCNLRCVMCPTVARGDFEIREMPVELFSKIVREVFPRTEHLTVGCGAEPLLSGNFDKYVQVIKTYRVPYTLIISNGSLLTEQKVKSILDADINELSISLEAASKEKYEAIRVGAKFNRLLDNLRKLNDLKAQRRTTRPLLSFNTVLMKSTLPELVPLITLAKETGAVNFCMTHLMSFSGLNNEQESLYYHQDFANQMMKEAYDHAESLGIRVFGPPLFNTEEPHDLRPTEKAGGGLACVQPWTFMVVDCDGNVTPCGWQYGKNSADSFKDRSFRQIWFGDMYTSLREEIRSGKLRPQCVACPAAGLGDVNRQESFKQIYL